MTFNMTLDLLQNPQAANTLKDGQRYGHNIINNFHRQAKKVFIEIKDKISS